MKSLKTDDFVINNYHLKNTEMALTHAQKCVYADALLLDNQRTQQTAVTASKHALEHVFGASCAIGAL